MWVGEVGEVDVVAAETLPAVGEEVEGAAIGGEEGGFLVGGGVDGGAEVFGAAPVAIG